LYEAQIGGFILLGKYKQANKSSEEIKKLATEIQAWMEEIIRICNIEEEGSLYNQLANATKQKLKMIDVILSQ